MRALERIHNLISGKHVVHVQVDCEADDNCYSIFNPLSQSEKCDPTGDYIRHWVPELANVQGNAIHAPHDRLPSDEFKKLNYPEPIVDYKFGRERALHRFKNVGQA